MGVDAAEVSTYKEYVAGLLAGVATVIIGHPFDTVKIHGIGGGVINEDEVAMIEPVLKVKLQKHNTDANGIKYKNGLHCAARILRNEGVRGLYRGASSSFVGMGFESSLLFGIYSQTKHSLQGKLHSSGPQPVIIVPSAAFSGAIISFVLCPTELVKCRMQVQGTDALIPRSGRYTGPIDCALQTLRSEGVAGLFRGGLTTFLRESLGNVMFFSVYEYIRHFMHLQLRDASSRHEGFTDLGIGIISGGLGGVAFWSAVLPLDVAKTIIQTDPDRNCTRNPLRVLNLVYRQAGIRGCYAGLGPTIVRAFPANAAAIVTWEFAMKILAVRH